MMINRLSNLESEYLISEVVAALERNRDKHVAEYETALVEYNKQRLSEAASWLNSISDGSTKHVPANFGLKQPKLMVTEYDRMIAIFKQTGKAAANMKKESASLSLDFDQADAIFNDNWDWVQDAKFINGTYAASAMR